MWALGWANNTVVEDGPRGHGHPTLSARSYEPVLDIYDSHA